jgi:hypothetical protein
MIILGTITDLAKGKPELLVENALLRQQLVILHRQVKRPVYRKTDRFLLVLRCHLESCVPMGCEVGQFSATITGIERPVDVLGSISKRRTLCLFIVTRRIPHPLSLAQHKSKPAPALLDQQTFQQFLRELARSAVRVVLEE